MFSVIFGASLYAPGRFLVSGAALESGMQHCVLKQKSMLAIVNSHDLLLSKSSWLVIWVGWCMAGGAQCASTIELWSVWEVMSQCVGAGHFFCEFCVGAIVGVGGLATVRLAVQ